jgi:predicted ATP-grasp superfamily ATP-dependent carboligase
LISDFLRLGFGVQVLIDIRIVKRFTQKFKNEINKQKVKFEVVSDKEQLFSRLEMLILNSNFILLIAPEFSDTLLNITKFVEAHLQSHQVLLNLPARAISIFSDKIKTERYVRSLGYQAPYSSEIGLISSLPVTDYQNCIIKPFDGVGSADTFWVTEQNVNARNALISAIVEKFPRHKYILQEKIQGIPLSAFIVCNKGKITYSTFNFQTIKFSLIERHTKILQLEYLGGYTPFTEISQEIKNILLKFASALCFQFHVTGFMGIDFIYDNISNHYVIVDINPRVTTPYIAISALFKQNHHNVVQCLFSDSFEDQINGMKHFRKSKNNEIELN